MFTCLHDFRGKLNRKTRSLLAPLFLTALLTPDLAAAGSGVVLMYHRIGEESAFPSTSVSREQFEEHVSLLENGRYTVWPLDRLVEALRAGGKIPDNTVAITFDDAYRTVYETAWPRLRRAGFPFTLFASTGAIDSGAENIMSWDQLREMTEAGVTVGNHTVSHLHMTGASRARNLDEIRKAQKRLTDQLGQAPTLFAYPYGEMSSAVRDLVVAEGFKAAFGQHSGVSHGAGDFFFLPRFPLNYRYGDLARFRMSVNALPLPVDGITPEDPLLATNPPNFGFSVDPTLKGLRQLACYHSQLGKVELTRLGERRIEIRFPGRFEQGRSRLNCTMPGPDGRWRWFGRQFFVNGNAG